MMQSALDPVPELPAGNPNAQDLVFTFALETWADARTRASFSPDVLVEHLLASPRVGRLVVGDPWRSALGLLQRPRRDVPAFPTADGRTLVSPRRLRRSEPVDIDELARWGSRYVARMRRAAAANGLSRPVLLATHPIVAAAADPADWAHVVYYGWDDWAAHPVYRPWWPAFERAYDDIRRHGHRVVGVSSRIVDRIGSPAPSAVVPNGLRPEEWRVPPPAVDWFGALPAPRMLYSGTLDSRLDLEIVRAVAKRYPEASLVFVGTPADAETVEALRAVPNVRVVPWQSRETIRALTFGCDVALLPHVTSELTLAMSPLKVYEYLAAGRPVVAVDLEPVHGLSGVIRSNTVEGFVTNIEVAIAGGPASEASRLTFVRENSWSRRFETLLDIAL